MLVGDRRAAADVFACRRPEGDDGIAAKKIVLQIARTTANKPQSQCWKAGRLHDETGIVQSCVLP